MHELINNIYKIQLPDWQNYDTINKQTMTYYQLWILWITNEEYGWNIHNLHKSAGKNTNSNHFHSWELVCLNIAVMPARCICSFVLTAAGATGAVWAVIAISCVRKLVHGGVQFGHPSPWDQVRSQVEQIHKHFVTVTI